MAKFFNPAFFQGPLSPSATAFFQNDDESTPPEPEPEPGTPNLLDTFGTTPRAILINSRPQVDHAGAVKMGSRPRIDMPGTVKRGGRPRVDMPGVVRLGGSPTIKIRGY